MKKKQETAISYRPTNPVTGAMLHAFAKKNKTNRNKFIDLAVREHIKRELHHLKKDGVDYDTNRIIRQAKTKVKLLKIMKRLGVS